MLLGMEDNVIGARIRSLREGKKLSQARLAALAEVDPSYLAKVERGEAEPSLTILGKVATGLGVELIVRLGDAPSVGKGPREPGTGWSFATRWNAEVDRLLAERPAHPWVEDRLRAGAALHGRAQATTDIREAVDKYRDELEEQLAGRTPPAARAGGEKATGIHPSDEVSSTRRKDAMRPAAAKDAKPGKARR